jgi:hypothetical protein
MGLEDPVADQAAPFALLLEEAKRDPANLKK